MTNIISTNDSIFTKNDMIMTDNGYYANLPIIHRSGGGNKNSDNNVSSNYKNLGFPALYLYTLNKKSENEMDDIEITNNEIMSDDLYNKLISLAELKPVNSKKYTKHNIKKNKGKKTRRNIK
jgi:hypothetical protein